MASRVAARAARRGRPHAGGLGFGGVVDHRRVRAVAGDRSAHGEGRHDRVRRLPTPHSSVVGGETPGRVLRQRSRVGRAERATLLASAVSHAAPRPRDATRPPRARHEERAPREAGAPSIAARNGAVGQRCDEDGRGSRRLMPGPNVPFPPMEAQLVEKLPEGERWQYEPKWDGFRGVLENDGGELALWSRNGRPLLRYFPELGALGDLLPPHSALDGEIVIERGGRLEFDALQLRLHPAESRIRKLSAEMPAGYVAFDILLWKGKPVHELPLEKRRGELERRAHGFQLSPVSRDRKQARKWLERLETAGLDGVVAKRLGLPYLPGSRDGVV